MPFEAVLRCTRLVVLLQMNFQRLTNDNSKFSLLVSAAFLPISVTLNLSPFIKSSPAFTSSYLLIFYYKIFQCHNLFAFLRAQNVITFCHLGTRTRHSMRHHLSKVVKRTGFPGVEWIRFCLGG